MIKDMLPGSTLEISWVASGTAPGSVTHTVTNGNETVVDTGTLIDSGDGLWYLGYSVPSSEGYYVVKTTATIGEKPYKNSIRFRVIELETD